MTQADFTAALLDADRPEPAGLRGPDAPRAGKRFDVYRNNVAVSLTEALRAGFPVIRKLVGDRFFDAMAGVFLRRHPPRSPLMMHYGAELPDFLASFPPAASLPYLPDIARLELALRRSYHAADAAPLTAEALSALPPDTLAETRFPPAPATLIVASRYPILSIWRANTTGGKPGQGAEIALISRPEFDPELDPISPGDAAVLGGLRTLPLGEAVKAGGAGYDFGPLLTLCLARGALTLSPEDPR